MWHMEAYLILLSSALFGDPLSDNHLTVWPKQIPSTCYGCIQALVRIR